MKQLMFVIYDSKANAYMQPWFLTTEPMAVRAFSDLINDPQSNAGKHPEDYTLFSIGNFNDNTAEVTWTPPLTLGNGIQFLQQQTPDKPQGLFETTNDHDQPSPDKFTDQGVAYTDGEDT